MTCTQRAVLVVVVFFSSLTHIVAAQSTPFHDTFNRTSIGSNYDGPRGTYYDPPVLNGATYVASDPNKNTVSILQSSTESIGPDQFARDTMVNSTSLGVFSLFLRTTLTADKTQIETGYELDYGHSWDGVGDWWVIYYKDATGFHAVQDTYPSTLPIPAGSVVEFRASGNNLQVVINGEVEWSGTHSGVMTGAPGLGVYGDSILDEFYAGNFSAQFHDDFNRTTLGASYLTPTDAYYAPPVLNGTTYVMSDITKNTVSILQPSAALIGADQFARQTMVNSTADGIFSLFLRTTLTSDKSQIATGYELDYGHSWDDNGDWWVIYYMNGSGFDVVQDTYPSTLPIPAGSVVELRASGNTLQFLINSQVEWTGTHNGVKTGAPGIGVWGDATIDEFYAGDFVPATAPDAPVIGTVTSGADGTTATVTWTDVANKTAYYVERCTGANCYTGFTLIGDSLPAGTTTFTNTGLTLGAIYGYRVRAHNAVGYSDYSSIAYLPTSTATPPATPTGLTATAASNGRSITLNWSFQDGSQTRVGILRCSGIGCTVTTLTSQLVRTATSYNDDSVVPGTVYRYVVYTANDSSSPSAFSFSDLAQVSTPHAPAAPTALTANIIGGAVVLSWADNADNETGYIVERCARYGCYGYENLPATIAANSTSFTDSGTSGGFYSYRVHAVNEVGASAFAEITSVDTPCGDVVLSPNKISLVVGESRTLDAFDASDLLLSGLTWKSNDTNLVSLTTDDPPVLTAVSVGTTTVEVSSGSSPSACVATLTIYPGPDLPEGTVKWSVPAAGGTPDIIPAVPSNEGVADVFTVSRNGKVQAITSDGHTKWTANTNGIVIADFQGGVIDAGDEIRKLDGKTGQPLASYPLQNSMWLFGVHTDGTVFAIDGNNIVGIDPKTATPKFSIPLQTGAYTDDSDCPGAEHHNSSPNYPWWWYDGNLYVAGDGYLYFSYAVDTNSKIGHCEEQSDTDGLIRKQVIQNQTTKTELRLLRISSAGQYIDIKIRQSEYTSASSYLKERMVIGTEGGKPIYGYQIGEQGSAAGTQTNSFLSNPLTDSNTGVIVTWPETTGPNNSFTRFTDAYGNVTVTSEGSNSTSSNAYVTTVTNGQVASENLIRGLDVQDIWPVLQTSGGRYIAFTSGHKILSFDKTGDVFWTKTADFGGQPQYVLADGKITYKDKVWTSTPEIVTLDAGGNEVSRVADTGIKQSWSGQEYRLGAGLESLSLPPDFPDGAGYAAVARGNPSENGMAFAQCPCWLQSSGGLSNGVSNPLQLAHLSGSMPELPTAEAGALLKTFVLLEGDPGLNLSPNCQTDPDRCHNVGNLFHLAAETARDEYMAEGNLPTAALRVSSVQDIAAQLVGNGQITGGVVYFGHGLIWKYPDRTASSALAPGEQAGPDTNVSPENVNLLSNSKLDSSAVIILRSCYAGFGSGRYSIAKQIADQLQRKVYAPLAGTYFSVDPNAKYKNGIVAPPVPNQKPIYMIQEGGARLKPFCPGALVCEE